MTCPFGPTISTMSPAVKSPSARRIPTARSDECFSVTAFIAPASRRNVPLASAAYSAQNFHADKRSSRGQKAVPTSASFNAGPMLAVEVNRTGTPAREANRAAESLEAIPPVPSLPPSPAATSFKSLPLLTSGTKRAPGEDGLRSYKPSTSDSNTNASAETRCATSAARRSLSPKRISEVATASFSLTMGTTCMRRRRSIVRCALRARSRRPASDCVNKT